MILITFTFVNLIKRNKRYDFTMKRVNLGEFEELVLLLVAILNGNAYGVLVMEELDTQAGQTALNQLKETRNRLWNQIPDLGNANFALWNKLAFIIK